MASLKVTCSCGVCFIHARVYVFDENKNGACARAESRRGSRGACASADGKDRRSTVPMSRNGHVRRTGNVTNLSQRNWRSHGHAREGKTEVDELYCRA